MAFGFVLRDLLSAANYCALTPTSPERQELLRWLQGAARRVRRMAEESGQSALLSPLAHLARAAEVAETNPAQARELVALVRAVFDAHDPPGLHPIAASSLDGASDVEDTNVLRWSSRSA